MWHLSGFCYLLGFFHGFRLYANTQTPMAVIVGSHTNIISQPHKHISCTYTFNHTHKRPIQFLSVFTHNCKQNPFNQDSNVPLSPHLPCRNWSTTDTTLYSPSPDCEVRSGGEHNCMLKRLRNGRPVLLSWCFLCGLIVGTCSHAALWVPVGVHVGLGVVQKSGRGGNIV